MFLFRLLPSFHELVLLVCCFLSIEDYFEGGYELGMPLDK
jgi:hypothetical protein